MILRLKRTPAIYLVGFMGCGKTTVGRLLAADLGWHFIDIDDDIEAVAGATISEIFSNRGEEEFRQMEWEAILARVRLVERGNASVVALGGGAYVPERTYRLIAANGVSIWLDCSLPVLQQRVAQEAHRPLARDPERFAELYRSRRAAYERADFRVDATSDDPQPILRQIVELPIF